MNIIMLGAPGAGKGTIAAQMEERYGITHVSSGDIFRENIKNETELGKLAKDYIHKGQLVPDDITINMMIDTLGSDKCKTGFILDGFPRTLVQAQQLDKALDERGSKIELVILVDASNDQIVDRLSGRRVCAKCGATYHIINMPSKKEGICDKCGGEVAQRKDDTKEVILDRLKTYDEQTKPLIDYYKSKGMLKIVPGCVESQEERLKMIDAMVKGEG